MNIARLKAEPFFKNLAPVKLVVPENCVPSNSTSFEDLTLAKETSSKNVAPVKSPFSKNWVPPKDTCSENVVY
jgi:hypothetical protein